MFGALILTPIVLAQTPDEYAYVIPLQFDNSLGSNDIEHMMPIEVNALALVDLGVITTTTDDYLWVSHDGFQVQGFAQDLDANGVRWWTHVSAPAGTSRENSLYLGGPDVDDGFPINHPDRNDAHIEIADSASLDILDDLDIRIEAGFENTNNICGILVDKTDNVNAFTSGGSNGYAIYSLGNRDEISIMPVAGFSATNNQYWDFKPFNDLYLCGIHSTLGNGLNTVRIVKGDLLNDLAFETITTFPLRDYTGNSYMNYFDHPVLLEGGTQYRFYSTCIVSCNGSNTTINGDSSIGTYSTSGALTHSTYGAFRTPAGSYSSTLAISYVDATNPVTTFQGRIDDTVLRATNEVWDGTNDVVLGMTYSSPTINLFVDSVNVGSVATSGGNIGTNANDLILGRYFNGHIKSIDIQASSTSVLNIPDFFPNRISEFQEGELANSWLWKGTITDDSASVNDAVYFITADTTNVNITAGPLALQPTPTPATTPEVLAGILNGAQVGGFHTPVPTVLAELPGMPKPPDPDHMQSEVYYAIIGFWIITLLATFFGAWMSEYIMAGIYLLGFGMISAYAGEDFTPWIVALMGPGILGMALILHQGR